MRNLPTLVVALGVASGLSASPGNFGEWQLTQDRLGCEIWTQTQLGMPSQMSISTGISGKEVIGFSGPDWRIGGPPFFDLGTEDSLARISVPGLGAHEDVRLTQEGKEVWLDPTNEHESHARLRRLVARAALAGQTLVAETSYGAFGIYAVEGLRVADEAFEECIEGLEVVS